MTIIFFGPEIFFSGNRNRLPLALVTLTMVLHHLCDIWEGPGVQEHPTTPPDARGSRSSDAPRFFSDDNHKSYWLGGGRARKKFTGSVWDNNADLPDRLLVAEFPPGLGVGILLEQRVRTDGPCSFIDPKQLWYV